MDDLDRFLDEDLVPGGGAPPRAPAPARAAELLRGDITSRALIAPETRTHARVVCREAGVAAGLAEASEVFARLGVKVEHRARDGEDVERGRVLLAVDGPAAAVLAAERLALNLVGRMSGIATATRDVQRVVAVANPRCRVAATRKTTPGFRAFEKKAVALGGGEPHRQGLWDAFLVKDNHLAIVKDPAEAVRRCRALLPGRPVEVEADSQAQAVAAARAGADWVLLDNMPPEEVAGAARAIRAVAPACRIEVSGGLTPERCAAYAPFADRLSLGWLTHSARSLDVGLDVA
ncbi:MAG TPA: carboxylating nicotinate-nucleotide diphosphorylase [Candidatus Thermoplasmatota archaeon]|nr:carboxylating nicotinate-nucleotide diphosphorylase [Candidatus Thermoplasmatota archaeon]